MNHIPSPDTSDAALERGFQAAGKSAPRVTLADLEANIVQTEILKHVTHGGQILRWAIITTKSGFAVTGRPSAAVSAENDDASIGEKVAFDNAKQELWPLMGYALKEWIRGNEALPAVGGCSFQKLPVVIQAFQMTQERRADNRDWPAWLNDAWQLDNSRPGSLQPTECPHSDGTDLLEIITLEGKHLISWGDWIIRGVKGELYPCKPEIFAATYKAA